MKKWTVFAGAALAVLVAVLWVGCEWTTGGTDEGLNTSRGAGLNINFSGVYRGMLSGGRAVARTSAGNITHLVINQSGNALEVTDNQGSHYRGAVGSPGVVAEATSGVYPAGAELVQAQVSWSGKDEVAQRNVEFVGVIHVIAVTDIQGTTSEDTRTQQSTRTYTQVIGIHTNLVVEITTPVPGGTVVTTIVYDEHTGREISRTEERIRSRSSTTEFSITEANSQYRLEGTWIEEGGVTAQVDARSPGTSGVIATTEAAGGGGGQ